MPKIEAPAVQVGQVWACNSVREQGRSVEVIAIRDDFAVVKTLTDSEAVRRDLDANERCRLAGSEALPVPNARSRVGQAGRIRLSRMRPTLNGYRLAADAAVVTDDALAALFASPDGAGVEEGDRDA
ncbi:hypothetical protein [Nonomuraea sp. NPDC049646]|uniref:hypothetical protein n=1 Tax=unclassified Nonomuraea TaxID=2593643 RepID=UPI00378E7BD8